MSPASHPKISAFLLASLLILLGLFPPETRPQAMVGCSVLIALLALLRWPDVSRAGGPGPVAVVLTALLGVVAALGAYAPSAAVEPLALALLALGAGLATASLIDDRSRAAVAAGLALAGGGAAAHGIYQKLWGLERMARRVLANPDLPDHQALVHRVEGGRAFGAFMTPAALGGMLALALPVTLGLAVGAAGRRRGLWVAIATVQAAGIVSAGSATAAAALVLAVGLAVLVWAASPRVVAAVLGLGLVVLAAVAIQRGGIVLRPDAPEGPWRLRAGNFAAAARMSADHPWKGVGPGNFAELYAGYRQPGDNEVRHVHNLPLELAAECGRPAAAVVTSLFFWLFAAPLVRERRCLRPWSAGLAVGLAAFALHNLGDFTAFMPSILWSAAVGQGLLARGDADRILVRSAPLPAAAALAIVLVAAGVTALGGLATASRVAARFAAFTGRDAQAHAQAERAARLAPWDVDAAVLLARAAARSAETVPDLRRDALLRAERAVELSPVRPSAREVRARARVLNGDLEGAFADLAQAARLYPLHASYARERDLLAGHLARLGTRSE